MRWPLPPPPSSPTIASRSRHPGIRSPAPPRSISIRRWPSRDISKRSRAGAPAKSPSSAPAAPPSAIPASRARAAQPARRSSFPTPSRIAACARSACAARPPIPTCGRSTFRRTTTARSRSTVTISLNFGTHDPATRTPGRLGASHHRAAAPTPRPAFQYRTASAGILGVYLTPHDAFPADDHADLELPAQPIARRHRLFEPARFAEAGARFHAARDGGLPQARGVSRRTMPAW